MKANKSILDKKAIVVGSGVEGGKTKMITDILNKTKEEYMILKVKKVNSCSECEFRRLHLMEGKDKCVLNMKIDYVYSAEQRHPQCPLQDTTELLEALEVLKNDLEWYFTLNERQSLAYNKLYKALGGKNE